MTLAVAAGVVSIIFVILLLRLSLDRFRMRLPDGLRGPWWILRLFFAVLFFLFLGGVLGVAGFVGFILWISSIVIAVMVLYQYRTIQRRAHLALLALAAEKNIPITTCVDAFAREQGGRFAAKARKFADRLFAGMPLPEAVAKSRGVLPRFSEIATRVGTECNQLGRALRDDINNYSDYEPVRKAIAARLLYFYMLLAFAPLLLSFMFIKIMPAYIKIFADFEVELPRITVWAIRLVGGPSMVPTLFLMELISLTAAICGALWYMGWTPWVLPGVRRLLVRFDRSTILRSLAFPAELHRPLQPTIEDLAIHYPNRAIRAKLRQVTTDVAAGHDWIASMLSQNLLELVDAGVLRAAQQVGNLPWALREMAESNERRLIYRMEMLIQIGSIVVIGLLGAAVLVFAAAFFAPLVKLIWSLA